MARYDTSHQPGLFHPALRVPCPPEGVVPQLLWSAMLPTDCCSVPQLNELRTSGKNSQLQAYGMQNGGHGYEEAAIRRAFDEVTSELAAPNARFLAKTSTGA